MTLDNNKSALQMKDCFCLGDAVVEPARNLITRDNESHRVPGRDMDVLMCLVQKETRVISRDEVIETVWRDALVNEEVLTLAISRLRGVLSDDSKAPQFIETIPKRGYRLMIPAQPCVDGSRRFIRPAITKPKLWVAVLAALLVIVTSLYIIVRVEYQKVSVSPESAIETTGNSN